MVRCLVNDSPQSFGSGLNTWGELLQRVDAGAEAEGQTVTAVRFDGVDQPTFREPAVRSLPLPSLQTIEVETVDPRRLLRSALATAGHSLPSLATSARRLAVVYRQASVEEGRRQLTALVSTIRTLTDLTLAAATAAGTSLESVECGRETGAEVLGAVGVALGTVAQGHDLADWSAVGDALERDLAPALLRWGIVFDSLHDLSHGDVTR